MISMTTYWQQLKDCIDHLQISNGKNQNTNQINIALSMIEIGLTIEKLGIIEIKKVVNKLQDKATLFDNEISIRTDKEYRFNLPKITNKESLIFAIIYYQHLQNYQQVSYQGVVYWFKQQIIDGINDKKIITLIQSRAMLESINQYCKAQNMIINESVLLKKMDESSKDYVDRISAVYNAEINESSSSEVSEEMSSQGDLINKLECALQNLMIKKQEIKNKCTIFFHKLNLYEQSKEKFNLLTNEWQNKWFITRFFYRLFSWVYKTPLMKNLTLAKEECTQAKKELHFEFPPKTINSYRLELKEQLEEINNECVKILKQIDAHTLEQEKQQQLLLEQAKNQNHEMEHSIPMETINLIESTDYVTTSLKKEEKNPQSYYYGFFKDRIPSKEAMGVIAAGVAAIIIQNLAS